MVWGALLRAGMQPRVTAMLRRPQQTWHGCARAVAVVASIAVAVATVSRLDGRGAERKRAAMARRTCCVIFVAQMALDLLPKLACAARHEQWTE